MSGVTFQTLASLGASNGNDGFTKILIHFDGADTSTTITDVAAGVGTPATWTANGNAQLDTAQSKFGGASGLFDGTGDYWASPDSTNFTLGSGNWTVDCWFNWNGGAGVRGFIAGQCDNTGAATNASITLEHQTNNTIRAIANVGGTPNLIASTTTITTTGWHHVAFVRVSSVIKLFLDGVQEGGDVAISGTVNDSTFAFSIGRGGEITGTPWNGWIDEFRLSTIARWTANFTPPTAAYS